MAIRIWQGYRLTPACIAAGLVLSLGGLGCSSAAAPDGSDQFALRSVNGNSLPAVISREPGRTLEILESALAFQSGDAYQTTATLRETVNGAATTRAASARGTYRLSGRRIVLTTADGSTLEGTLDAGRLEYRSEGSNVYVYER